MRPAPSGIAVDLGVRRVTQDDEARADGKPVGLPRLGFGTASLHHLSGPRERSGLLEAAAEAGLTHFDTAPLYGFGLAEAEIGRVLGHDHRITVATKVGLYPPGGAGQSRFQMLARKALGKLAPTLSRARADYSVRRAEQSLTGSLRRLGREIVDVLLVHEPQRGLLDTDEWAAWLAREKARGRCRATGVAGEADLVRPLMGAGFVDVVQTRDPVPADIVAGSEGRPIISYGCLGARAFSDGRATADLVREALGRNPAGTVLVATRREDRIAGFRAALDSVAAAR